MSRPLPVALPGVALESQQSEDPSQMKKQETTGTRPESGEAIVVGAIGSVAPWFLTGWAHEVEIEFMINTGCQVTILSTTVFERMCTVDPAVRSALRPCLRRLVSADSSPLIVQGQLELVIVFPGLCCDMLFVVANICSDGLLGTGALQSYLPHQLDLRTGQLWADGWSTLQLHQRPLTPDLDGLSTTSVVIPPDSEIVATFSVSAIRPHGCALVEPTRCLTEEYGVVVGHTLVDASSGSGSVLIVNPDVEVVVLPGLTLISKLVPVAAISVAMEDTGLPNDGPAALPEYLEEIVDDVITTDARPVRCGPRWLAPAGLGKKQKCVREMLHGGQIEPSDSPWASPVVLVSKKDGTTWFCVDYRRLNTLTTKDAYPLPRIDDSLHLLGNQQWFSTMDLESGYWQVAMSPEAKRKAVFVTNEGLFQFWVMPFGLCNSPVIFKRLMDHVLCGMRWSRCLVYLDDVISFGGTVTEALRRLEEVLCHLSNFGLQLKAKKCTFMQMEVVFLGIREVRYRTGMPLIRSKVSDMLLALSDIIADLLKFCRSGGAPGGPDAEGSPLCVDGPATDGIRGLEGMPPRTHPYPGFSRRRRTLCS